MNLSANCEMPNITNLQETTEPRNTGPWLADNQSRDLNDELWLAVSVGSC